MLSGRVLILVVEDEPIVREGIRMDLEDAGFEVLEAGSADQAYKLLTGASDLAQRIRVLFTDIRMPGVLDGWDLAERARLLRPDLGVVYASGFSATPVRAVPGSLFIAKPYRTSTLLNSIRQAAQA